MQSLASARFARSQWDGPAILLAAPLHPTLSWVGGPFPGCTQVTSRLWPPSISFPGGCSLGSPVPSSLSQWGRSQPVWGIQAAANPQPGPAVPGSWAAVPLAPSHTGLPVDASGKTVCSRSCPQTSGCLSVKPGHRGCPCWQQGPAHLAARSHPTPCRIRLVGYIFHPVTGLWQGQAAPRQGSQRWSVPAWQPQAGPGCGCEPRVPGMGALKRRWRHVQRVIVKVETCVQQAVGLCPRPPRHSGLPT